MTNKIIDAAREAEAYATSQTNDIVDWKAIAQERFYAIAFAAGMERAAEICDATVVGDEYATAIINSYADAIRAEAQNQPTGKGEV